MTRGSPNLRPHAFGEDRVIGGIVPAPRRARARDDALCAMTQITRGDTDRVTDGVRGPDRLVTDEGTPATTPYRIEQAGEDEAHRQPADQRRHCAHRILLEVQVARAHT